MSYMYAYVCVCIYIHTHTYIHIYIYLQSRIFKTFLINVKVLNFFFKENDKDYHLDQT